jgi:hypothetical protein
LTVIFSEQFLQQRATPAQIGAILASFLHFNPRPTIHAVRDNARPVQSQFSALRLGLIQRGCV